MVVDEHTHVASGQLAPVWGNLTGLTVSSGSGVYLYTESGSYLDFTSGLGVTATGHCHPRVVEAIQRQAEQLLHVHLATVRHQPIFELVRELTQFMPSQLDCFYFTNSGGEAVESALRLCRQVTNRPNVIAFQGGYHGRSAVTLGLSSAKATYHRGNRPLCIGSIIAPYPLPRSRSTNLKSVAEWCLDELRMILATYSPPEDTAAVLIEPLLGEGGYVVPPRGFLKGIRAICDEHGIPLIFDEVQSGFCRTGRTFAFEHFGVEPDVLVMAKSLASGMPLSCIGAPRSTMEHWRPGSHGGTYSGNPIAVAAGTATMRVLRDEELAERARSHGGHLLRSLREVQESAASLADVRGLGLMVGCEFRDEDDLPSPQAARTIRELCLDARLILSTCGVHDNVIRWVPPLVVGAEELETGIEIFSKAVNEYESRTR